MRKRSWIIPAVLLVGAAAVVSGWVVRRDRDKPSPYRTATVDRGDVKLQVSATGTLTAVTTVQVGSQVSGTISALYADFNDHVRKGQLLAQLDPTFLKAQVAQSQADLQKSEVQVRQADRDYERQKPLRDQGLASQAEIDQTETALAAAKADQQSSQAALDRAVTNLKYATIVSPIDGVVVSRNVDVGQTVAASLSAPTLFTIANDLTQMQLDASVDEADIGEIQVGQNVSFTVDAFPDRTFHGSVKQIRLAPQTVQNVVSYDVIVLVSNPDQKLLPGMTANATFQVDEADNVLRVPAAALRFHPQGAGRRMQAGTAAGQRGAGFAQGGAAQSGTAQGGAAQGGTPQSGTLQGGGRQFRTQGGTSQGGSTQGGAGQGGTFSGGQGQSDPGQGEGGQSARRPQVVWILGAGQKIHPVPVRPGLSDGTYTAVYSDSLSEGMTVVTGMSSASGGGQSQTVNPFMPTPPGGGRGGRR